VLVGKPGKLRGKLVLLAIRRDDRHRETVLETSRDDALDAADMVDIGDDLLAGFANAIATERHVAGRHVDDLAGMFGAVLQHEAAVDFDTHALKAPPFDARRR